MLPAVFRTEEREKEVLFSNLPMGTLYVTLNVRVDDKRYGYEDFSSFQGMRVGIIRGSSDGERFLRYCEKFGVKPIIVPYAETQALLSALEDGTLDGVAITHLGRSSTFRSVAQFSPEPVYIAVAKNRPDLLARLDAAMNAIVLRDPNYMMRLYDKYFAVSMAQQPVFTKEEEAFLKQADVVVAAYDPSWAPLEYTDTETGMFSGVTSDLLSTFSRYTGLRFRFEPIDQAEALEKVKKGLIDMVCSVTGDYLWDERNKMYTTRYYLRAPIMLVRTKQPHAIERIALQGGYWFSEHVAADHPGKEIIFYKNVRECFDALLKGDADAVYANVYVTNYLLTERRYESLAATSMSKYTSEICFGISKCADPRLLSILDKCIQYTAPERMDELVLKNTTKPRQITLLDFVAQHLIEVGCGMLAVFGVILLLLVYNLAIKTRSNHRIQALLYRDGLTNLDNMNKFYVECGKLLRKAPSGSYALLYGDINQFKTINDNLGFAVGDQILRAFGAILQRNVKDGECCARASADHFILLVRYADWESLLVRIEEIGMELDEWRVAGHGVPDRHSVRCLFGERDGRVRSAPHVGFCQLRAQERQADDEEHCPLRREDAAGSAVAARTGRKAGDRPVPRRIRCLFPAQGGHAGRRAHRQRGIGPVESPYAGPAYAGKLYPVFRAERLRGRSGFVHLRTGLPDRARVAGARDDR